MTGYNPNYGFQQPLNYEAATMMFNQPPTPSMGFNAPTGFSFDQVQGAPQTFGQGMNHALNQAGLGWLTPNTPQTGVLGYDANLLNASPQQLVAQPVADPSMTTMDWLGAGMGVAQLGLGMFMGDRKLDLAEDQLALKRKAYGDQRADQARLDKAYTGYGR